MPDGTFAGAILAPITLNGAQTNSIGIPPPPTETTDPTFAKVESELTLLHNELQGIETRISINADSLFGGVPVQPVGVSATGIGVGLVNVLYDRTMLLHGIVVRINKELDRFAGRL